MPGKVACSLSCTPNIALILLALASIPSSCRPDMVMLLCGCSLRLRNTLPPATFAIVVSTMKRSAIVGSSLRLFISSFRRDSFARTLRPDRRLWLRLICTNTPGFSGHLGAAVGCTVVWVEWEDTVGLGGPPSGLCSQRSRFFFTVSKACVYRLTGSSFVVLCPDRFCYRGRDENPLGVWFITG